MMKFAVTLIAVLVGLSSTSFALGNAPVISSIKTGETGGVTKEFIAIYNNSADPIDVSGWCLVYSSSTDATKSKLTCIESGLPQVSLYLSPNSYARFSTAEFQAVTLGFLPDFTFSSGLSGTAGHVRLFDKNNVEIDKVGWGSASTPEQTPVPAHSSGFILQRKLVAGTTLLQDTDNNQADFDSLVLDAIPASGIVEHQEIVDVCPNIEDLQAVIPDDYYFNEAGGCAQDQCDNLEGLQETFPAGYESADGINCTKVVVAVESSILKITELLPNSSSVDTGNEFIEIYNPNNKTVDLYGYRLELGPAYTKFYSLQQQLLDPFSYISFNDIFTGLVLPNSSASVRLLAPSGDVVSETDTYENPKDDQSWALINDVWQFTVYPTPAIANLPTVVVTTTTAESPEENEPLPDCGPGRYRNPETNRCRNITSGDQELNACEAGQTRNPETNRCRSAVSSNGLVLCKAGQERNPETNRCRNIVSTASALKPCGPGEVRNPETNRCRKVETLGASTLASVQDVPAESGTTTNWWILGLIFAGAAGYGVYEWRAEIGRALSRMRPR